MVGRITGATSRPEASKRYIGLLDVYGFEFFDVNSFEQLCINFANEKLQQFFLVTVFTAEEQVYKDEGVPWTPIPYADNKLVISIIEEQPEGIYPTLDSMCRTGNSTGRQFCAALHEIAAKRKAKDKKFDVLGAPKINRKESRTKEAVHTLGTLGTLGRWFPVTRSAFITREARGRQWLGTARNR